MEFPNLVYRSPGEHQIGVKSFTYRQVLDQDELDIMLLDGWAITIDDALIEKAAIVVVAVEPTPVVEEEKLLKPKGKKAE